MIFQLIGGRREPALRVFFVPASLTSSAILGPDGRIAQRLPEYEHRPQQLEMAEAVEQAIREKTHLIAEAGTGVGKSFAYLIPAILSATAAQGEPAKKEKHPVVISTNTISLQEQLINRDIPFLNSVLPLEFSAVLVKGRTNYISLRRLNGALSRAQTMFESEESDQLRQIRDWAEQTADGSRSDLEFRPHPKVWDEVQSEHGNCLGRRCPTYDDCFYYRARRRVWNADILVVNHALFFSDLALRREGARILPDYRVVVLDEAHSVESVAGAHLGITISSGQFDYLLNKLFNERTRKGLLATHGLVRAQQQVVHLRHVVGDFFDALQDWLRRHGPDNGRLRTPPDLANEINGPLRELAGTIAVYAEKLKREEEKIEFTAAAERCAGLADTLGDWLNQSLADSVYWAEYSGGKRRRATLYCAPIEVAETLRRELFDKTESVILTSATLAVSGEDFHFTRQRLGVGECLQRKLGSPFDYRSNVQLILPQSMPDPGGSAAEYESAVCEKIKKYVAQTGGRAFVLFTSYGMLRSAAARLARWFAEEEIGLYQQGAGMPTSLMLERFRNDHRAAIFGTDSFWQGVDVPGEALQNVIITKLPFSVPDHPLLQARVEAIKERGGNPFMEYQVPEAVIKLKQGFGRLIRRKTDRGQVVILDPRVQTKRYGRAFLESLPDCGVVIDDE